MHDKYLKSLLTPLFTLLFLIFVAIFFCASFQLPAKVCYPTFILSLGIFAIAPQSLFLIGLALFMSGIGDMVGSMGLFIPQVAAFASAHICYIIFFLKNSKKVPHVYSYLAVACLLAFGVFIILPHVASISDRIAVIAYMIIITGMLYSVLQYKGNKKAAFILAALPFVFSDSMIAWTRFVGQLKYSSLLIMTTYYAAQYIFFLSAVKSTSSNR